MAPIAPSIPSKASLFPWKEFLKSAADLPPLMKLIILYCFLLTTIVITAMVEKSAIPVYLGLIGMMVTFMVFIVMYMIKPPSIDQALSKGHTRRSKKILGEEVGAA